MSDTQLRSIVMQPGINRDTTEYMAEGGWVDGNNIRFRNGRAEKIGGWVRETTSQATSPTTQLLTGVCRKLLAWANLSGTKLLAAGTHAKLELIENNIIHDITPILRNASLTNAITTSVGLSIVTITDITHSIQVGSYIFVNSQAVAVDGITLAGGYIVTSVVDVDNYQVDSGVAASGTTALAGGALDIDVLISSGEIDNGNFTGYSGGTWNTPGDAGQGYNRPREGIGGLKLRLWSLDNWGEDLIACPRGGGIYQWDATSGASTRAAIIANAPTENNMVLVSQPSRHLVTFGTQEVLSGVFNPLIIRWASQELLTDWTPTPSNSSGEYLIPKGVEITSVVQTRGEIVVFTLNEAYSMRYVGGSEVFRFQPLGNNSSVISQNGAVDVNGVVYWMGVDGFYAYDGVIRRLGSSIDKYLFDPDGEGRINPDQVDKIQAVINKEFDEVWYFYPSFNSTENDTYINYNFLTRTYSYGKMERTAWADRGVFSKPLATSTASLIYQHETTKDADGAPLPAFIRSAYFDIDEGEQLAFVDRILPDIRLPSSRNIEISLLTKRYPHPNADIISKGPYYFDDTGNKISLRARGRQMSIRYEVTATGSDFEIGKVRLGVQIDGER